MEGKTGSLVHHSYQSIQITDYNLSASSVCSLILITESDSGFSLRMCHAQSWRKWWWIVLVSAAKLKLVCLLCTQFFSCSIVAHLLNLFADLCRSTPGPAGRWRWRPQHPLDPQRPSQRKRGGGQGRRAEWRETFASTCRVSNEQY